MLALIVAGEAIFFLPFVLPRIFRITLLQVFAINDSQLGQLFAVYGTIALIAYLVGGPLADRFSTRWLMSIALWSTGASGFLLATLPGFYGLMGLYAFWGVSTILLFWAPLLRSTREVGGRGGSNLAFGLLEGGRGASAALIGTFAVALLAMLLPESEAVTEAGRNAAFQRVIRLFSSFVLFAGFVVFLVFRDRNRGEESPRLDWGQVRQVARYPQVWLQAAIIVCGYTGYRVTDGFPALAADYLGLDELGAAAFTTQALWLRPLAALAGGILATWFSTTRMVQISFMLVCTTSLGISQGWVVPGMAVMFGLVVTGTACSVYALRGLYYAIMEEGQVPLAVTGTAVGLVSIIGYLPDIYVSRMLGYFLDRYPGVEGHQHMYGWLAGFTFCGLIAVTLYRGVVRRQLAQG